MGPVESRIGLKGDFELSPGELLNPKSTLTLTLNLRLPQRENESQHQLSEIPLVDPTGDK